MNNWTYETCPSIIFILLHDYKTGKEIMINPKSIEMIKDNKILLQGHGTYVKESYDEIKNIITQVLNGVNFSK